MISGSAHNPKCHRSSSATPLIRILKGLENSVLIEGFPANRGVNKNELSHNQPNSCSPELHVARSHLLGGGGRRGNICTQW